MQTKMTSVIRTSLLGRLADLNGRIDALEIEQAGEGGVDVTALLLQLRHERDQISDALDAATVIDDAPFDTEAVEIGDSVTLRGRDGAVERYVLIDGRLGVRARPDWVSVASPLGAALLGRSKGEEVRVQTPGGEASYVVLSFERFISRPPRR